MTLGGFANKETVNRYLMMESGGTQRPPQDLGNLSTSPKRHSLGITSNAALSLKTNNLKYHLMRDLLQKKSLEEIIQLKQRLINTAKMAEEEKKKGHKKGGGGRVVDAQPRQYSSNVVGAGMIPGGMLPQSPGGSESRGSSKHSSSEEDDAEPFDMSQHQTGGQPQAPPQMLSKNSLPS